jgi:protein TonB
VSIQDDTEAMPGGAPPSADPVASGGGARASESKPSVSAPATPQANIRPADEPGDNQPSAPDADRIGAAPPAGPPSGSAAIPTGAAVLDAAAGAEGGAPAAVAAAASGGEEEPLLGGVATGAAASSSGGDAAAELAARVGAAIQARKAYPEAARRRGAEGVVRLKLRVSGDGRLVAARLAASSGSSLLDRAALDLASSVFPVDNPARRDFELVLAVKYSLSDLRGGP